MCMDVCMQCMICLSARERELASIRSWPVRGGAGHIFRAHVDKHTYIHTYLWGKYISNLLWWDIWRNKTQRCCRLISSILCVCMHTHIHVCMYTCWSRAVDRQTNGSIEDQDIYLPIQTGCNAPLCTDSILSYPTCKTSHLADGGNVKTPMAITTAMMELRA